MAFLAPLIAPLIPGLAGLGLVGEAIVGVGLSFGVSYLAKKLQPQSSTAGAQGMQLSVSYDINGPRQWGVGTFATAGSVIYHNVYGPNGNDYVQYVFRLADFPCTSLEEVYVYGKKVTLGTRVETARVSGRTVSEFPGAMWVEFHDGSWDQDVDADLVAKATGSDGWSSNSRGRGVCYVRVTLKYNAKLYKQGFPPFLWVVKGAKLYDWRKDSTAGGSGAHRWGESNTYEWTDNAAVIAYNYMRGLYVHGHHVGGMNAPVTSLPIDIFTAAASACGEDVSLKGGGTETRYTVNGLVSLDTEHATVVRDFVAAMAGSLVDAGGIFKLFPGVAQTPVLTITDADLVANADIRFVPKLSRSSLVNAVFGSFNDPASMYQSVSLPPRVSSEDQLADGDTPLTENYGLNYVSRGTQGQRVLEILRRRGRHQAQLSFTVSAVGAMLEAGDWVVVNSEYFGLSNMVFEVQQATLTREFTVPLELREISASVFAWSTSDELDALTPRDVGAGGERFATPQSVALTAVMFVGDGDIQRPGLHITWDPIDDQTVTSLKLRYRKVGDTVALERTILEPDTGYYDWIDGIQGGVDYEAELDLITLPQRATVASAWVSSASSTGTQVVAVAAIANDIPDEIVTYQKQSQQVRLEQQLAFGSEFLQGSVAERLAEQMRLINETAAAAVAIGSQNQSGVRITQQNVQTLLYSFSQYKIEVNAQINDPVTGIPAVAASVLDLTGRVEATETGITAVEARAFLAVSVSGPMGLITGGIDVYANEQFSSIGFLADKFFLAMPDGTGAKNIVTVGELADGSTGVVIDAEQTIMKGSVKMEHLETISLEALNGDIKTLTAWRIQSADNSSYWDLETGDLQIG